MFSDTGYGSWVIYPYIRYPSGIVTFGNQTIDGAGKSFAGIGRMFLSSGPGTSATLSTGSIYFRTGTVTFANAGTTIRAGLQDVAATALEDGTYDVYGEVVGGSGALATATFSSITMTSGSKTVAHGDLVAIIVEMTAKGGTDSVAVNSSNLTSIIPYASADTGSGPAVTTQVFQTSVVFDNGVVGWLGYGSFGCDVPASSLFNSGSSPDEYALVFRSPGQLRVHSVFAYLSSVGTADDFELILYDSPRGVPSVLATVSVDATYLGGNSGVLEIPLASAITLNAYAEYAIAVRPTTTNSIQYNYISFGSNAALRAPTILGTNWAQGSRTDQTGPFTLDTTKLPMLGVRVSAIDDGKKTPRTRPLR